MLELAENETKKGIRSDYEFAMSKHTKWKIGPVSLTRIYKRPFQLVEFHNVDINTQKVNMKVKPDFDFKKPEWIFKIELARGQNRP